MTFEAPSMDLQRDNRYFYLLSLQVDAFQKYFDIDIFTERVEFLNPKSIKER